MRQWMLPAPCMCRNHLLGEHREMHAFAGALNHKKNVRGHIVDNQLDPTLLQERHDELANEIDRRARITGRGKGHQTPLPSFNYDYLPDDLKNIRLDVRAARRLLISRCDECARITKLVLKGSLVPMEKDPYD